MTPTQDREEWPEDLEFRAFAAKIADAVMLAAERGWRVTVDDCRETTCCPLGAVTLVNLRTGCIQSNRPRLWVCATAGLNPTSSESFMNGFDGRCEDSDPYYRLGRAYRAWALARNGGPDGG